jgi:flavin-dependent dehydrogenase
LARYCAFNHQEGGDLMQDFYDVVIMGGGPAGSTLAALLKRRSKLSVAVFERDVFPREHIGESLVHALMPILEDSGALSKVLASECWVQKFGGIFAWEKKQPSVTFFDHVNWLEDGVHRWALHVDRYEFDKILLDHASDQKAHVFQGVGIKRYSPGENFSVVTLDDDRTVRCRLFVDASGRQNSIVTKRSRQHLSQYKNVAIWNHFLDCRPAQSIDAPWNIFHEPNFSPIACFAFDHGWVWYIPVPKVLNGERILTYSIGIVTSPAILNDPARNYMDVTRFLEELKQIDFLRDLIAEAKPIRDEMLVIANYSMVNEHFCDFDERWMLIGDAAYFVDPLFSSGATFAAGMAATADLVIRSTLEGDLTESALRGVWHDFDNEWQQIAYSFALSIDQWYHAIAKNNPGSPYWTIRSNSASDLGIREETFQALVDTAMTPDLLQVLTTGTVRMEDLDRAGPLLRTLAELDQIEPNDDDQIVLSSDIEIHESPTVDVPGFKASLAPADIPPNVKTMIAQYWKTLPEPRPPIPSPLETLRKCHRVYRRGHEHDFSRHVRFIDEIEGGCDLLRRIGEGSVRYGELKRGLKARQIRVLKRLIAANMIRAHKSEDLASPA